MEKITEGLLARVWQSRVLCDRELVAVGGEGLRVIYPGRINGEGGPDFHHAIIATNGGDLRGDVELHVRSSGWQAHGHHRDPHYNGVILHVVMWHDRERPTVLQNGKSVPVLSLCPYLEDVDWSSSLLAIADEPCRGTVACLGDALVGEVLDRAGEERFRSKADCFRAELAVKGGDQVLYEGLMRALGYSKNKETFWELARRMPLEMLEEIVQRESLESCGAALGAALWGEATLVEWHLCGVRPTNIPQRRIAGAGYLLARYRARGLVQGLLQLVREADAGSGHRRLEAGLMIRRGDYGTLIGQGRAREMVVNVLLPFSFAWADGPLGEHAIELYRTYPRLDENQITREMRIQLLVGSRVVNSARRQQGLVHLWKSFCLERRCPQCPLGTNLDTSEVSPILGAT